MGKKGNGKIRLTVQAKGGYKDRAGRHYSDLEGAALLGSGRATLTQWKARKTPVELTQGRKPKLPNLQKVDGGYRNQHGLVFTEEQKKALERAVNRSNYRRKKQIAQEDAMVTASGRSNAQMRLMGKESDFIIAQQSRSLQHFKSMAEYDKFMKKQERIQSGEYLDDRTRLYKANHMKALENVFGDDAKDVIMKIRMMKPEKYREMLQKDEFLEVNYVYDPSARSGKLNKIRQSLGMKEKEEDVFSELEE